MFERHLVYSVYVFYITKHNGTFRTLERFVEHIYHSKDYINGQLVPSVFTGVEVARGVNLATHHHLALTDRGVIPVPPPSTEVKFLRYKPGR
jgi:hypothetical protein